MSTVAGIQVFEEEKFIRPTLLSLSDFFDHVVVVEGCWESTSKLTNTERSRDNTIGLIKDVVREKSNVELHYANEKDQIAQRTKIWRICSQLKPDWYWQGDGDEIFHEKDLEEFKMIPSQPWNCVNPLHYRFWNDLETYDLWRTGGSRYFRVSGLSPEKISCGFNCNWLSYSGNNLWNKVNVNTPTLFHPSYAKGISRHELKFKHRTIDDKRQFPHGYDKNKIDTTGLNLMKMDPKDLPKYFGE